MVGLGSVRLLTGLHRSYTLAGLVAGAVAISLLTAAAVVLPFTRGDDLTVQVCAAVINLLIGAAIGSLLTTVLSHTVLDRERSWQR